MCHEDIDWLMSKGWWVSVAPVMSKGKWAWTCGVYKRGKKTGNWVTEDCKTHKSPAKAFEWGANRVMELVGESGINEQSAHYMTCNDNL